MISTREAVLLLTAGALGFVGGSLARQRSAAADASPQVIRASRFELVDESGRVVAFWGHDDYRHTVIAFTPDGGAEAAWFGVDSVASGTLRVGGEGGHATLNLWRGKPVLAMGDKRFATRLLLGFIQSDYPSPAEDSWALMFRRPDLAVVGTLKDPLRGSYTGVLKIIDSSGKAWSPP